MKTVINVAKIRKETNLVVFALYAQKNQAYVFLLAAKLDIGIGIEELNIFFVSYLLC